MQCENVKGIISATVRLDSWLDRNGWCGWDPFDIRGTYLLKKLDHLPESLPFRALKKLILSMLDMNPILIRRVMRVRPEINAKAMGLFLSSYCNLYLATKENCYLSKACDCAKWLEQNRSKNYQGWSWGYPFDWESPIHIPKGTPSSIASVTIGDGYYKLYKCTHDKRYLSVCRQICDFFLKELKLAYDDGSATCYSYTPLDDYQVHNTNLFVGEFLSRIGKETSDIELMEKGIRCGKFALKEQAEEGYLPYWGLSQTNLYGHGKIHTDHYHSGFEIRSLYGIWKNTGEAKFKESYERYFDWYIDNMFEDKVVPKFTPKSLYPIDVHSCSEAILCRTALLDDHPEQLDYIVGSIEWIIKNMEHGEGEYTYLIKDLPLVGRWRVNIPMIRWGQAWMFRALSELYKKIN